MGYYDLLKDERWQEKRRGILQRDGFKCVMCGDEKKMLEVHHGYYNPWKKKEPWDYEDDTLSSLCRECHDERQKLLAAVHKCIAEVHPKGLEAFLEKIPGLALDIANDIAYEDAYEVIHPYLEYSVTIAIDSEFNEATVRDAARNAEEAFRGIIVDYRSTEASGDPHGTVKVFGPDKAIEEKIRRWIENRTEHVSF